MASYLAVGIAFFIHAILGVSFYLTQAPDNCSPAPQLASWIYLGAVALLALDLNMYSIRYMHLPYYVQILVEIIGSLAVLEFFSIAVWCMVERLIYYVVRIILLEVGLQAETYLTVEYWSLGFVTTAVAVAFLAIMKLAIQPQLQVNNLFGHKATKV